jgi:hypothetical protein
MTVDAVMLRPLKPVADCGNKKREGDEQCDLGPEKPDDGCHKCRYKCYDSDGDDKEGAGYILVINKNGEIKKQPDSCDGDQVVEGLCSGNKPISDVEDCKYGCENGACVEIEIGKIIHKIGPLQGKKVGPYAAFGISNIKNISSDSEVEILAKQKFYIDNNGITQNTSGDVYVTVPMEKKPMKDEPNYKWSGKRKFTEDESGTYNYKVLIKNSKGELLDEVASEHAFSIVGETPCAKKGEVVYGDSVPGPKLCCDDLKIRPWGCEVPKNGSEGVCVEKLTCGNDTCDEGEDECNCEEDCGSCEEDEDCASGKTCYKDECVPWGDVCPTLGEYQCSESKESDCDGIWFDDYGPKGLDCCCSGELCPVVQGDDDDDEGDDDDDNECVEQGSNSNLPRCKECLGEMCEEYKNQKDGADKSMEECKEHCIDVYPPYVSCVDQHKQSDNPKCKDCLREVCGSLVNDDDMSKKALDQCKDHCLDN